VNDQINLSDNASIRVRLQGMDRKVFVIPSIHAKRTNDTNFIWILSGSGQAEQLPIELLSEDGEFAEITGNISQETLIITNPRLK